MLLRCTIVAIYDWIGNNDLNIGLISVTVRLSR